MHGWLRRALVALLVGVVSPASASRLANVGPPASSAAAEIWGSASGILTSIPAERAGLSEAQRLEVPRGTRCLYDQSASDISNDPINHRDPTGRFLDIVAVGLAYGPKAAAGYAARIGQHLVSAALDSAATFCGPLCAVLGNPLRGETALDADRAAGQAGFLEAINPANQAARSAVAAGDAEGYAKGVQIADTAKGLVDSALLAVGGAKLITGVASAALSPKFNLNGALDSVARAHSGPTPSQFGGKTAPPEDLLLTHGTTRNAAEKILAEGFRPGIGDAVYFAEDSATAQLFAAEKAAATRAREVTLLRYRVSPELAEQLGLERGIVGEYMSMKTGDLPLGSSGFEWILDHASIDAFNAAVQSGKVPVRVIQLGRNF